MTGKHIAATVATADMAKNTPGRTGKNSPEKNPTDTSSKKIIWSGNEDQIQDERTGQDRTGERGEAGTAVVFSGSRGGKSSATRQARQTNSKAKFVEKKRREIRGKADIFLR